MEDKPVDVLILGAGLSGMAAAWELQKLGVETRILEARTRPGGRILTLRGFADGMYAEAGAMSFPDSEPLTLRYVAEFDLGLQSKRQPGSKNYYFFGKRCLPSDATSGWPGLTREEQSLGADGLMKKYIMPALAKVGNPDSPGWPAPEVRYLDTMSGAEYVRQQGASPAAVDLLARGLFDEDGEGFDACSALFLFGWLALLLPYHTLYTLQGGMEHLPQAFAARLSGRIDYGSVVKRIRRGRDGVSAEYEKNGRLVRARARYMICTIPFPALRDIAVQPAWSKMRRRVVEEVRNTSVVRIFVQSKTRFWMSPERTGEFFTDLPIKNLYSAYDGPGERGIIESYTTGPVARQLAKMDAGQQVSEATAEISKVFPLLREQGEGGQAQDWDADPYAKGGYAWYAPGQFLELYPHIAKPEGRIHFAGDHTTLLPGWMDGAFRAGQRAASEVRQRIEEDNQGG